MSFTLLLAQSDRIVINWETSINQEVCKSVIAWIFITASLLLKLILKLVHPGHNKQPKAADRSVL